MTKVLVTGADGFIGSHLSELLVREGHDVRAFVLYNSEGRRGWIDRIDPDCRDELDIHIGDIRDPQSAATAVRGADIVYHLAALIGIPYSYQAADSYVDTNIRGTLNLLQAARDEDIQRFMQTSTSEVYGTAQTVPISEDHPLNAQSPYAATKVASDQLALSFHRSFELPVTVVRPFNTFGPRQSARAVIPTIISQIASGAKSLKLGSLHPTRDFNYVEDTARGMVAAASARNTVGETVNLATGYEISIGDLAAMIADIMGVEIEITADDARIRPKASEVERLLGNPSRMTELTGWRALCAGPDGLRDGLSRTIDWLSRPENLAAYRPDEYQV